MPARRQNFDPERTMPKMFERKTKIAAGLIDMNNTAEKNSRFRPNAGII
jgi:hypothetical protein